MPLPASILNETNRTLQEQLDRVTGDLFERQREVAEHKDSLTFMREHLSQIQYQSNVINDSLRHRTEDLRKTASEITQMKNENDSLGRAVKTSQSESKRVTNLVSSLITTVTSVRHEVLSKLEESKDLECDAKELVTVRLMKEEQGSSLEASLQKFSESVWTKLELLEAQTAQQEKALSFSHDEQAAAIRELEVAQLSLQESIADQKESLRALELVQRQVASLDRSIEVNASTMAHLKSKYRNRESVRESLRASLEIFSAEYKELSKQLHEKENSANRYLHDIQTLSVFLRNQLLEMKRMQRGVSADRHRLVQMRRSLNNFTVLCEERQLALDEHREVYRGMQQMNGRTLEAAESDGRSFLSSLHDMREKLERRLVMTGNRYLRAQQKVSAAMNELCQIGHIANETNDTVQLRVAELRTLQGAHHNAEEELSRLVEHSSALEDSVQAARLLISTAKEQKLNDHMLFQADTVERIQLLRDDLEEMRDRHRRLLSETISLRASMRRATAQYLGSTLSGEQLSEQCRLLADEVSGLERERGDTEVHRKIQEERLTTHDASLSVLRQALQSRVEDLKGAAQLPEILRDEILREEEVIRVDMESSMLELHLEQNALHEHKEELQGLKKKKELLQMRYNETMTSMSRVLCANGPAVLPMESCAIIEASDLRPEALHARLLLQRSSEREQLMNRGNYLDLRLLTVEKETRMLERALQSLREESNGASSIALPKTSTSRSRSDISEFNAHLDEVVFLSTNTLTTELKLQDEVMKEIALNRHSNKLHLSNLRQTLREMQATVKQKRTQARRLQEEFHRQNSMTNLCVAATRF